jgi:hypothetical protein
MDLNRLYFDHQASLIAADRSRSTVTRRARLLIASAIATHKLGGTLRGMADEYEAKARELDPAGK